MAEMFLPVAGITANDLTDTFGADRSGGRSHKGIDIFAKEGTAVVAVRSGTVVKAGNSGLGGLRVWVKDEDGVFHYYAHLSAIDVKDGQKVKAGQRLGGVGKTGNAASTPAHLHYSVNPAGTWRSLVIAQRVRGGGEIGDVDQQHGALFLAQRL